MIARESILTLGLLLLVCATFSLLLVNSYFPITEGWFQDFSNYMDRGQVMYRDFYMFVPPGFPLLMHVISAASNNSFLAFRLYGVAESLVLIAVTYILVRRLFVPRIAFVAVLTGFVLYTANLQDIFYGYYQTSLLIALVALYLATRCLETFDTGGWWYPVLFGLASGVLVLFKQSAGAVFPVAIGLTLLALTVRRDRHRAIRNAGVSLAAYLVVLIVAAGLLAANGALQPALQQILGGTDAKGGLGAILFGFLGHVPIIATALVVAGVLDVAFLLKRAAPSSHRHDGGLIVVATFTVIALATFLALRTMPVNVDTGGFRDARQYLVYATVGLMAIYCLTLVRELWRGLGGDRPVRLLLVVAASAIIYVHGMSGIIEEHALLLAAALLIGVALSAAVSLPHARDVAIYLGAAVLLLTIAIQRNALPYLWWGLNELPPTSQATTVFDDPHLAGLSASPAYTADMNAIYEAVKVNEHPGDTMYSFPHINYFNVMAGLASPTFGKVDYFDVAPDSLARLDADLLRATPPTFLVWLELTPAEWTYHEEVFRAGQPSGQREIKAAVDQLLASGAYRSLGRFTVGESDPIGIYVRYR